jgi:hypothetical protein
MGRNLTNLPISSSFQYLLQVSGSEVTDGLGVDVDVLNISASYATSASHAVQADSALAADTSTSASHAIFADTAGSATTATSASHAVNSDTAISASFATTASFALNAANTTYDLDSLQVGSDVALTLVGSDASLDTVTLVAGTAISLTDDGSNNITIDASVPAFDTGSFMTTGSVTDATLTFTKGDGSTFPLVVDNVANATSASYVEGANVDGAVATATSASYALTASFAENVSTPTLQQVTDAGATTTNAITASGAEINGDVSISGDLDVNGTITYISSSTLQIGDNVIEINYNKTAGNSGILTYDTTSPFTASLLWDATADRWVAGPFGSEETIILSSDTGSMAVATAISASHAVQADSALSANTATSASHAVQADSALAADTATSASHALIADSALSATTATTASYAEKVKSAAVGTNLEFGVPFMTGTGADEVGTDTADFNYNPSSNILTVAEVDGNAATATTASYAITASYALSTDSSGFPYTGSAAILGTLDVNVSASADGYTITSGSLSGSLIDNLGQQAIVTGSAVKHIVNLSQTEYDALTPDANTLYVIDGAETLGDTVVSGSLIGEVTALSITSNTASLDCSLGNMYTLVIDQQTDVHLSSSNIQAGQVINLEVTHDATNSGSLSFGTEFKFPGGTAPTITATTSSIDVLSFTAFRDTTLLGTSLLNFS